MMQFYETYKGDENVSSLLRQISWTNSLMIMSAAKSRQEREFYLRMCIKNNYSSRELNRQISTGYYQRYILSGGTALPSIAKATNEEYATARTISPLMVSEYATKMIDKGLLERKVSEIKELLGKMPDGQ